MNHWRLNCDIFVGCLIIFIDIWIHELNDVFKISSERDMLIDLEGNFLVLDLIISLNDFLTIVDNDAGVLQILKSLLTGHVIYLEFQWVVLIRNFYLFGTTDS